MTHSGRESAVQAGTQGSQDTDTLILVHVFAGGQKAVGYSIPRDDVVNFPHATFDGDAGSQGRGLRPRHRGSWSVGGETCG